MNWNHCILYAAGLLVTFAYGMYNLSCTEHLFQALLHIEVNLQLRYQFINITVYRNLLSTKTVKTKKKNIQYSEIVWTP